MSVLKAGDGGRRGEEHAAQANKRIKGRGPAPRPDAFSAPVFLLPGGCWLPPGTDAAKCPDGRRVAGGRRPTRGALAARGEASTFVFCCGTGRRPLQRSESYGRRRRTHLTPPCFKPTPRRIPPLLEFCGRARKRIRGRVRSFATTCCSRAAPAAGAPPHRAPPPEHLIFISRCTD